MQFKDKGIYVMADNENKKAGPPRIALGDYKSARHSLARIIRMYFRKELDTEHFRNLCYSLNILLSYDKFEKETELERRMSELENRRGQLTLSITPQEMIGLDPDERDERIMELLQKGEYMEKMGYMKIPDKMSVAGTEPATSDVTPIPDPLCQISDEVKQPQPRRLKL
jgi:hypothetical protein